MRFYFIVQLGVISVEVVIKSGSFKYEGKWLHEEVEQGWRKDGSLGDTQGDGGWAREAVLDFDLLSSV